MIGWVLKFVTGGGLGSVTRQLSDWDIRRREAANDHDRVMAETMIQQLAMQQKVLIEEQRHASTRWVRPAFAVIVMVYWAKLVIVDTILELGSTPYPGDHVAWFVTLIPTAYFLARPFEKRVG